MEAICQEIIATSKNNTAVIPTIFFGGGTPTNLPASDLARILQTIRENYPVSTDAEITIESNPSDVNVEYLTTLLHAGVNRLSFGVQTFNDSLLKTIDRLHTGADAMKAVGYAKEAGFTNISLDLMFGLPRQTLSDWDRTLDAAFAMAIPHLSIYALILEEGTPFFARRERGKLTVPSENVEVVMFTHAIDRTQSAGYQQYEISNYAKDGLESRHNKIYWRNEEYFGFGAGAVSFRKGVRATNIRRPSAYIEAVLSGSPLIGDFEEVSQRESMGETLMLGLRMLVGVDLNAFAERFGVRVEEYFDSVVSKHIEGGLLEINTSHLRLTRKGIFLANEVMADFLP